MLRKLLRTLSLFDEILEVMVWFVGRAVQRHPFKAFALVLVCVGVGLCLHDPCDSDPQPAEVSLASEADPLLDGDLDLFGTDPTASADFTVDSVSGPHDNHRATIVFRGQKYWVQAGSAVPSHATPELVVSRITCREIAVLDVKDRAMTSRPVPKRPAHLLPDPLLTSRFRLQAVTGEHPNFIAVAEYRGQTYIVQKGTRVPDNDPQLEMVKLGSDSVIVRELASGRELRFTLQDIELDLDL